MPLTQLQPGQMMADTVDLPYCGTTPTSGPTDVTLSWRPISKDGRTIGSADSANIPTLKLLSLPASPGRKASGCFDNLGTIGGTFQIIKFTLDKQLSASAPFNPFVTWFAHDVVQEVYQREFQLLAADGTVISECLPPGNNYVPTNIWRMGEIYYFENCPLDTSAVHPGETYQVVVGMRDSQNHWLPTDKAGADRVVLGTYVAQP